MFYFVIFLVTVAVLAILLAPLWRGAETAGGGEDIAVYKAQLKEVEKDLAKGTLSADEAEVARIEVSRRLLAADKRAQAQSVKTSGPKRGLAGVLFVGLAAAVLFGYSQLGRPDLPDQPLLARLEAAKEARASRPAQAEVEAQIERPPLEIDPQYQELLEQLRRALEDRPDDVQGLRLLAYHEANTGHMIAAHTAQKKLISVLGEDAVGRDFEVLAEYLVLSTNGYVSPEAETALTAALSRDPNLPRARYFSGLLMAQTGRPDVAIRMWQALLREGPEDAPWIGAIRQVYNDAARAAGVPPLDDLRGPSASDIEAAEEMSVEDRMEMIQGMVASLSDRLATDGGSPEEWARLIRALGVLGRTGEASAIWNEAQDVFAGNAAALELLRGAAQDAEVAQ